MSDEAKFKISTAFKGKPLLESTKIKMSKSKLGKKKPNISKALLGKKLTQKHVNNISKGKLGTGTIKIIQYYNDEPIKEWNSLSEASKELNINNGHISSVCSGKRKTAGGFNWKYKIN